jgi:sulfatase modifying factor 1
MRMLPRILALSALLTPVSLPAQDGKDVGVFRRESAPALGRRLAVVVGIDEYESLRKLDCAQRDAEDVARELEAIGFTVKQMRVDGRGDAPRPLSPTAILAQIDKMCRLAQGGGTVLFYFSGHGFENAKGQTFLCPFGTDPAQLEGTGLDLEEVQKRLIASGVPQRLLVVDMCRNELGKSATEAPIRLERFQKAQGTGLLFSTAPGSRSYEPLPGMKDDAGVVIQNGLFTHYLLRGLRGEADRGAQAKPDGFVTFREVAYFVADGLAAMSMRHSQCEQVPYLRWDGTADDVLLRVLPAPVAATAPVVQPTVQPAVQPAAQPQPVVPSKPEVAASRDVSSWAKVLRVDPDPNVVTDADARSKIVASGWPWRVEDKVSGIVLLLVPPGEFMMGSPANEPDRSSDETQHRRRITHAFYLGETEVTQASWQRVMGNNPSSRQGASNPVEMVSWYDIQPFLQKTGLSLPSEAQWEYACRAGTTTPFSFGATLTAQQANVGDQTVPVGTLGKNVWGFADMHGNVWEWCAGGDGAYPSDGATEAPEAGTSRVLRGGSWSSGLARCRAAFRYGTAPAFRTGSLGFRAARTP